MALKEIIKDARLRKRLKQEDVSELVGVTVQTYSKWENGKTEPKASQIAKISKVLSLSADAICNGRESKKMEMLEFMRLTSMLTHKMSKFDQQMAIWESIENDEKYLETLKKYNKEYEMMPDEIKEEYAWNDQKEKEYREEQIELEIKQQETTK